MPFHGTAINSNEDKDNDNATVVNFKHNDVKKTNSFQESLDEVDDIIVNCKNNDIKNTNEFEDDDDIGDIFTSKNKTIVNCKNNRVKKTNDFEDNFESIKDLHNFDVATVNVFVNDERNIDRGKCEDVINRYKIVDKDYSVNDITKQDDIVSNKHSLSDQIRINNDDKDEANNNKTVFKTLKRKNIQELDRDGANIVWKKRREKTPNWRLSSGVLVTLVILNVTSQGVAVEVISTSTLASLLGYPSTCTLGAEVQPCTLSLGCWLRGGTRVRGCGGWLFACCQPPEETYNSFDNSIPSSDWQYKVSPPRLRQVPQRNVMPNNVFRRRVDEDVTQVDCGVPSNRVLQKRIIGGREARFAEFPWQAHVRISEFQCGGVLVSQRYVATAAHCVSRAHIRDIVVWLGALDTSAGSHTARKVGVHQKILHPLFQFRMTQPDRYDIALLKLSRLISFTRHIRAICLPDTSMVLRGRSAIIAGWGKTDATDTHTGTNMLRSATVPILSKEQCITWHQSKQISVEIHSEMICAGHSDGHQDACLGDSGGPLIVSEHGRYYLVGITSAGFGCGVDHQPGIYHNVLVTADWIRRVLQDEQRRETSFERNSYM